MSIGSRIVVGAVAGALAVVPMTLEFWGARATKRIDEVPPHKAIRSLSDAMPEPELSLVSAVAHVGVGAVAGASYGVVMPRRLRGGVSGILFGIVVWATGYEVVMPLLTDIAPAHRDQRSRAIVIFVAHVIWGWALGRAARSRS